MIVRTDPAGPGDWTVIAVGETVLAVPDRVRIDELAARIAGPDGFRTALEHLVGGGIAAAPDFALIDARDGIVRLVLRGAPEVVVGAERISGAGVTTWTERVLELAGELRLAVPGSSWTLVVGAAAPAAALTAESVAAPAAVPVQRDPSPVREDTPPHATLAPPGDEIPVRAAEPYAFLFGDTIYHTASGLDVRIPNPDPTRPGDHDGRTVLVEDLGREDLHGRGELDGRDARAPRELPSTPVASAPELALELPGGVVEPLTAPLLVGRSPSDPGLDASGGPPRLVRIAADDKDISRTHARIEVAGGAVVVTDLDSKNGTSVTMPGSAPRKLRAGEPAVVLPDTLIDLGGGVTLTVRETVAEGAA